MNRADKSGSGRRWPWQQPKSTPALKPAVPRTDDFFSEIPGSGPSPGKGFWRACFKTQPTHSSSASLERLFASLVFAPTANAVFAARLVRIADQLTYRQLACVAILAEGAQSDFIADLTQRSPDANICLLALRSARTRLTGNDKALWNRVNPGEEIVPPGQATGRLMEALPSIQGH
jgi:hypothetical protein